MKGCAWHSTVCATKPLIGELIDEVQQLEAAGELSPLLSDLGQQRPHRRVGEQVHCSSVFDCCVSSTTDL